MSQAGKTSPLYRLALCGVCHSRGRGKRQDSSQRLVVLHKVFCSDMAHITSTVNLLVKPKVSQEGREVPSFLP